CNSITGMPSSYVQLWRVPSPPPIGELFHKLKNTSGCRQMLASVGSFQREILYPMPYDYLAGDLAAVIREKSEAIDTPPTTMLINRLTIKPGMGKRFACAKENVFIPRVTSAPLGWKLMAAGSILGGTPGNVIHCWVLPNSNRLLESMRSL